MKNLVDALVFEFTQKADWITWKQHPLSSERPQAGYKEPDWVIIYSVVENAVMDRIDPVHNRIRWYLGSRQ